MSKFKKGQKVWTYYSVFKDNTVCHECIYCGEYDESFTDVSFGENHHYLTWNTNVFSTKKECLQHIVNNIKIETLE